jgi:hypothetical protein
VGIPYFVEHKLQCEGGISLLNLISLAFPTITHLEKDLSLRQTPKNKCHFLDHGAWENNDG